MDERAGAYRWSDRAVAVRCRATEDPPPRRDLRAELLDLKRFVRDVPDFPKPGILFKDITPLLRDGAALRESVDQLSARLEGRRVDAVAGIESRGFLFAAALALKLGVGLIPLR